MCLGIPGQILDISDPAQLRATVDVRGVPQEVSVALLGLGEPDGARVGDWVVVHVGFAMEKVDAAEARRTLDELDELSDMYAELEHRDGAGEGAGLPAGRPGLDA